MEPGRWGRITDIYHATIARPPEERASFLGDECHGDESLRKQVEAMVKSHERSGDFIESPAFAIAPELLMDEPTGNLIGQSIGHYRIESFLGGGGMGEVYLARDERLGRKVALKLLPDHLTEDETQLSRFKTEARSASALNHPNILTVHEIGAEGTRQFIATEFIEGITLRALLARGRMNLHDALEIAVQVASALAAAHETGVVHRDIKPENIMLRPDGYAKVLDFGIAKLTEQHPGSDCHEIGTTTLQTQPGLLLGTARYMSPEQTRGQKADVRSDIWSLGVVLYEMVGGISPFAGETPSDCIASILKTEPPPLSDVLSEVPVKLQSILQKALCKNRDERYQTIKEMLADLRNLKEEREEGYSPQTKARAEPVVSKIKRHKRGALVMSAAILAAALAYYFYFFAPAQSQSEKSIAVLPFENLSDDKENAFFADGIQDDILTKLAKTGDLKVISRTSVMPYRGARNTRQIGSALGVSHVLEGSVQRAGSKVRVNAQLIDTRTDTHVWAEQYYRDLRDVFAIQNDISRRVVDALEIRLGAEEAQRLVKKPTQNLKAYDAYLLGRFELNKFTEAGFKKSVPHFEKAIVLDPEFALAHAGLAETHNMIGYWGYLPPEEAFPEAKRAALQALKLDPTLAEAHAALAVVQLEYEWLFREADHHFREATRFNPNFAIAHVWFAEFLFEMGQFQDGEVELERARELDPLSVRISFDLAVKFYWKREFDRALEQLQKTISMDPDNSLAFDFLSTVFHKKNMPDQAFTASQKAKTLAGEFSREEMADMQKAYEAAGLSGYFRKENELRQKRLAEGKYQSLLNIAMNYAIAGDDSQALDWLEGAVQEHTPWLPELKVEPNWDGLRSQPRFIAVLKKIGLEK